MRNGLKASPVVVETKPAVVTAKGLHVRIADNVMSERLGDEVILLHLKTNRFFSLNRTGARLWELLVSGEQIGAIEERLCQEFEVEPSEVATEVEHMLAAMRDEQLIQFEEG
jgi:hypothetical protein